MNWSISLGVGVAGTVESELMKRGKAALESYHGSFLVVLNRMELIFCLVSKSSTACATGVTPPAEAEIAVDTHTTQGIGVEREFDMVSRF